MVLNISKQHYCREFFGQVFTAVTVNISFISFVDKRYFIYFVDKKVPSILWIGRFHQLCRYYLDSIVFVKDSTYCLDYLSHLGAWLRPVFNAVRRCFVVHNVFHNLISNRPVNDFRHQNPSFQKCFHNGLASSCV